MFSGLLFQEVFNILDVIEAIINKKPQLRNVPQLVFNTLTELFSYFAGFEFDKFENFGCIFTKNAKIYFSDRQVSGNIHFGYSDHGSWRPVSA